MKPSLSHEEEAPLHLEQIKHQRNGFRMASGPLNGFLSSNREMRQNGGTSDNVLVKTGPAAFCWEEVNKSVALTNRSVRREAAISIVITSIIKAR